TLQTARSVKALLLHTQTETDFQSRLTDGCPPRDGSDIPARLARCRVSINLRTFILLSLLGSRLSCGCHCPKKTLGPPVLSQRSGLRSLERRDCHAESSSLGVL